MTRWLVLILTALTLGFAGTASADCTFQSFLDQRTGKILNCTTCCTGNNCSTTCF
jgi:hypothetical protein